MGRVWLVGWLCVCVNSLLCVWCVTGIVNNMGALRTSPLKDWGNGKITRSWEKDGRTHYEVLNWDGTPSAVVHQFDRHKELSDYFFKYRTNQLLEEWKKNHHDK